jgi:hypothetical protein
MSNVFPHSNNWDEERHRKFEEDSRRRWDETRKEIKEWQKEEAKRRNPNKSNQFSFTSTPPPTSFEQAVKAIAMEAAELLIRKHQDYGPDNINNAPGGAINGLLVRMHDKMERLKTLILSKNTPKYESIEDTFIDMLNYSVIALMVQRGKWPKK